MAESPGKRLAVFGGSFNPPTCVHCDIARELAREFNEVIVVPCGPRPDKPSVNEIPAGHRGAMAELAFGGLRKVRVDLFDLASPVFTRTWQLEQRYCARAEVWHLIGADLFAGGARGESQIQREWERGPWLWSNLRFAVLARPGFVLEPADLPPQARLVRYLLPGSSSEMRERIEQNKSVRGLVPPKVEAYIAAYGLYG